MHYVPTLNIMETSRNIQYFVKENKSTLFEIFKPLVPYIVGLLLIDLIITIFMQKSGSKFEFSLGSIFSAYFFAVLMITWHRVVIHGPDKYERMNPLKPKKNELMFMGMWILIFLATAIVFVIVGVACLAAVTLGKISGLVALIIAFAVLIIGGTYISYRFFFYFPAKAVNSSLTLKQSFSLTRGYIWKLIAATFMAILKTWGLMILYMLIVFMGGMSVIGYIFGSGVIAHIASFLLNLPMTLYFQPLLIAYGVTGLSNYYMHAMQNKVEAHGSA